MNMTCKSVNKHEYYEVPFSMVSGVGETLSRIAKANAILRRSCYIGFCDVNEAVYFDGNVRSCFSRFCARHSRNS